MIFDNYEEYKQLINEVSSILKGSDKTLEEPGEPVDDESVGGEVPLDEVLPPSKGHETGERVPNTSAKNQPYYGGPWVEGRLEERLCNLLEELTGDQTTNAQQSVRQGKVGVVPTLGHGSGSSNTAAGKRREEVDPMTKVKKAEAQTDAQMDTKPEDESDEMEDAMKSLGLDSDEAGAAASI